jgi:aconitate hydratase 2/2-methylisocitrate dehydratase
MGKDAQVYLGSAELAAVCALLGKIPNVSEYHQVVKEKIAQHEENIYQYLNFHHMDDYVSEKKVIGISPVS